MVSRAACGDGSGINGASRSHWASVRSDGYGLRATALHISAHPFLSLDDLLSLSYRLPSLFPTHSYSTVPCCPSFVAALPCLFLSFCFKYSIYRTFRAKSKVISEAKEPFCGLAFCSFPWLFRCY